MVARINIFLRTALCWPIVGGEVEEEISVNLKLTSLKEIAHPVIGHAAKKISSRLMRQAFKSTQTNMKREVYRAEFRQMQVAGCLVKEISCTFWASSRRRNFDLGLSSIDIDCNVFGLSIPDSTSVEFSYAKATIGKLDTLLGPSWDISVRDGVTRFVTIVRLRVTSDLKICGFIKVADYDGVLPTASIAYRQELHNHMNATAM